MMGVVKFMVFRWLLLVIVNMVALSNSVVASQVTCQSVFVDQQRHLDVSSTINDQRLALMSKVDELIQKYPTSIGLRKNIQFQFTATPYDSNEPKLFAGHRDILVVSLNGMDSMRRAELRADLLRSLSKESISHPLKSEATHLLNRVGDSVFHYFYGYNHERYEMPSSLRLEPVILLTPVEHQRLDQYISNMYSKKNAALGPGHYDGATESVGKLDDNRPTCGIGHNCTSWITTAPIGQNGERYFELMGADLSKDPYAVNPGWWLLYLATTAPKERIPFLIYFTQNPLESFTGDSINWSFNPI